MRKTLKGLPVGVKVRDAHRDVGMILEGGMIRYPETRDLPIGYADRFGPFVVVDGPVKLTPAERRAAVLLGYSAMSTDCGCVTADDLGAGPPHCHPDTIAHVHPECILGHRSGARK